MIGNVVGGAACVLLALAFCGATLGVLAGSFWLAFKWITGG